MCRACVVGNTVLGLTRRIDDDHGWAGELVGVQYGAIEVVDVSGRRLRNVNVTVSHQDAAEFLAPLRSSVQLAAEGGQLRDLSTETRRRRLATGVGVRLGVEHHDLDVG